MVLYKDKQSVDASKDEIWQGEYQCEQVPAWQGVAVEARSGHEALRVHLYTLTFLLTVWHSARALGIGGGSFPPF